MPFSMGFTTPTPITFKTTPSITNLNNNHHALDASYIKRAAELSDKSACFTSPHPNFGCVIATKGRVVGEGDLYTQDTTPAEVLAVEDAEEWCGGATAYVNMEPGDCHDDCTAVSAFIKVVSVCFLLFGLFLLGSVTTRPTLI